MLSVKLRLMTRVGWRRRPTYSHDLWCYCTCNGVRTLGLNNKWHCKQINNVADRGRGRGRGRARGGLLLGLELVTACRDSFPPRITEVAQEFNKFTNCQWRKPRVATRRAAARRLVHFFKWRAIYFVLTARV